MSTAAANVRARSQPVSRGYRSYQGSLATPADVQADRGRERLGPSPQFVQDELEEVLNALPLFEQAHKPMVELPQPMPNLVELALDMLEALHQSVRRILRPLAHYAAAIASAVEAGKVSPTEPPPVPVES